MRKHAFLVLICALAMSVLSAAANKSVSKPAGPAPDKAYLVKLLDGWNALNPANMAQYYAQGDYMFFDIAPLKYNNWAEYQKGTTELLKGYKSFRMTLGDDAQIHQQGDIAWSAATVSEDAVTVGGKHEMTTFRWTVIFQKQDGKWLIVHEHTSVPEQ